ncbi:MAG: flagellar basal-body rod protein FlgG [Planctomycetaceae bacterium]|nr:MAG: flagellar basal-body rod protein FlgG [Planctomycetaceae bacterium]
MLRAFYTSATGMRAQELLIDTTANNLANVNTSGFKRSQLDFADLMYAKIRPAGAEISAAQLAPTGLEIGSGVRATGTTKIFTPGTLEETGNATDVAIEGAGFFRVVLDSGEERYTRDGAFRVNAAGYLVTTDGHMVDAGLRIPENAAPSSVTITPDGRVSAVVNGESLAAGTLQLYTFVNPAGLSSEGGNLYSRTLASGEPMGGPPGLNGRGSLRQAFLERSNVEVVREMVALITAQRAYEINSRAIRAGDEMLSNTSQIVR